MRISQKEFRVSPLLLLLVTPALIAGPPANWEGVKQLAAGEEIRVAMIDGRSVRGGFQSASDDALAVATSKSPETLSRAMIAKVSAKAKGHRLRNALIGLGAGAGAGLTAGAITDHGCPASGCFLVGKNFAKEVFTPAGALVGLTVGALIPTGGWRDVYRAK
jgi:hypothetical protein